MRRFRKDRALVENSGDTKQVNSAREYEALIALNAQADLVHVLSSREGRRVVWRLLEDCGLFRQTFREGRPDSSAFLEGQRSIGLQLFAAIQQADPVAYALMAREDGEERRTEQDVRESLAINRLRSGEEPGDDEPE